MKEVPTTALYGSRFATFAPGSYKQNVDFGDKFSNFFLSFTHVYEDIYRVVCRICFGTFPVVVLFSFSVNEKQPKSGTIMKTTRNNTNQEGGFLDRAQQDRKQPQNDGLYENRTGSNDDSIAERREGTWMDHTYSVIRAKVQKCAVNKWSLALGIASLSSYDADDDETEEDDEGEWSRYCQLYARCLRRNTNLGMDSQGHQELKVPCEPPIPLEIGQYPHSMAFNRRGDSVLIASSVGVAVVKLPRMLSEESVFLGTTDRRGTKGRSHFYNFLAREAESRYVLNPFSQERFAIQISSFALTLKKKCSVAFIGTEIYGYDDNTIIQAAWHPASDSEVVVLSQDGIRCFSLHIDSEQPTQLFLFSPGAMKMPPIAFAFGENRGWERMSIFLLCENADIFCVCPYFPYHALLHRTEFEELERGLDEMRHFHPHLDSNLGKSADFLHSCFEPYGDSDSSGSCVWYRRVAAPSDSIFGLETEYPSFPCIQGPLPIHPGIPRLARGDFACDIQVLPKSIVSIPCFVVLLQSGGLLNFGGQTNLNIVPMWSFPALLTNDILALISLSFLAIEESEKEEDAAYKERNSFLLVDASKCGEISDAEQLHRKVVEQTGDILCFSSSLWESTVQLPYMLADSFRKDAIHIVYPEGALFVEQNWPSWFESIVNCSLPEEEKPEEVVRYFHTLHSSGTYGICGAAVLPDPRMSHQLLQFQEYDSVDKPVGFSLVPILAPALFNNDPQLDAYDTHKEINNLQPFSEIVARFSGVETKCDVFEQKDRDPFNRLVLAADYVQRKIIPEFRAFRDAAEARSAFLGKASDQIQDHLDKCKSQINALKQSFEKCIRKIDWLQKRNDLLIQRLSCILLTLTSRKRLSKREREFYKYLKQVKTECNSRKAELRKVESVTEKVKEGEHVSLEDMLGMAKVSESIQHQNETVQRVRQWERDELLARLNQIEAKHSSNKQLLERCSDLLNDVMSSVADRHIEGDNMEDNRKRQEQQNMDSFYKRVDEKNENFNVEYATPSGNGMYTPRSHSRSRSSRRQRVGIGNGLSGIAVVSTPKPPRDSSLFSGNAWTKKPDDPSLAFKDSNGNTQSSIRQTPRSSNRARALQFPTPPTRDIFHKHREVDEEEVEWGGEG